MHTLINVTKLPMNQQFNAKKVYLFIMRSLSSSKNRVNLILSSLSISLLYLFISSCHSLVEKILE